MLLGLQMTMQVLPLLESLSKSPQSASMTASGMMDAVECVIVNDELKTVWEGIQCAISSSK